MTTYWDKERYEKIKTQCRDDISNNKQTATYYMKVYKRMIEIEDYEAAKAITEILKPLGYHTADTHPHIKSLNS